MSRRSRWATAARAVAAALWAATLWLSVREGIARLRWLRSSDASERARAAAASLPDGEVVASVEGPDAGARAVPLRPRDPRLLVIAGSERFATDGVEAARLHVRAAEVAPYAGRVLGAAAVALLDRGIAQARAAADDAERAQRALRSKDSGAADLLETSRRERAAARASFAALVEIDGLVAATAPGRRAISDRVDEARRWLRDLGDGR